MIWIITLKCPLLFSLSSWWVPFTLHLFYSSLLQDCKLLRERDHMFYKSAIHKAPCFKPCVYGMIKRCWDSSSRVYPGALDTIKKRIQIHHVRCLRCNNFYMWLLWRFYMWLEICRFQSIIWAFVIVLKLCFVDFKFLCIHVEYIECCFNVPYLTNDKIDLVC